MLPRSLYTVSLGMRTVFNWDFSRRVIGRLFDFSSTQRRQTDRQTDTAVCVEGSPSTSPSSVFCSDGEGTALHLDCTVLLCVHT